MDRTVRPIRRARGVAVFDRIDVDVIDMPGEIVFVRDQVFPEATLPDAAFGFVEAAWRTPFAGGNSPRKGGFDVPPAGGIVGIAFRQAPQAM